MPTQYTLLAPIDFSTQDRTTDAQVTKVQCLKNAAYDDSSRGTLPFFAFYRPIIQQYVSEFARKNPLFPEEEIADLFWLTMRHAFALLRGYEHKGYGSFRNLLRQLVNYNALQSAEQMVYMDQISLNDRQFQQGQFVDVAIMCLVMQRNPKYAKLKFIRNFIFNPKLMANIPQEEIPAVESILEEFESEVDALSEKFADINEKMGNIEALASLIGEERLAKLIRFGAEVNGKRDFATSFFGHIRKDPAWFGLPSDMFEDDGDSVSSLADDAKL